MAEPETPTKQRALAMRKAAGDQVAADDNDNANEPLKATIPGLRYPGNQKRN